MHFLSEQHRSEFLAVPSLVRFTMAQGLDAREPTLLIKGPTHALKHLISFERLAIIVGQIDEGCLVYGVAIFDDVANPQIFWSWTERIDEKNALLAIAEGQECTIHLFNEMALNIAWTKVLISPFRGEKLSTMVKESVLRKTDRVTDTDMLASFFGAAREYEDLAYAIMADISGLSDWKHIDNLYVTNSLSTGALSIADADEGGQQEQLAVFLVDNLDAMGAIHSPKIEEPSGQRELTDILLFHEYGTVIIESKTLSVLSRSTYPDRKRLALTTRKHVTKAIRQLQGALKGLRAGYTVQDSGGNILAIPREVPTHAIVLVPDLSLLAEATDLGADALETFGRDTTALLHILDPIQMLRVVQAAQSSTIFSDEMTDLMKFDFFLERRFRHALRQESPDFDVIFRQPKDYDIGDVSAETPVET